MCARLLRSSLGRVLVFVAVLPCVHLPAVDLVALDLILRERVRCVAVDKGAAIAPPHARRRSALLEAAVFLVQPVEWSLRGKPNMLNTAARGA